MLVCECFICRSDAAGMDNKNWNFDFNAQEGEPNEPAAYEPEAYVPDPAFAEPTRTANIATEPEPFSPPAGFSGYDLDDEASVSTPQTTTNTIGEPVEPPAPQQNKTQESTYQFTDYQSSTSSQRQNTNSPHPTPEFMSASSTQSPFHQSDIAKWLQQQQERLLEENRRTLEMLRNQDNNDSIPDLGYSYIIQGPPEDRYTKEPIIPKKLTDKIDDETLFQHHETATAEQNEAYRKLLYLKRLINSDLYWYKTKEKNFSYTATLFKVAVVVLSSIVTVLLGLDYVASSPEHQQILKDIALIISALIAVITGLERFFDAKDLMVQYMRTYDKLEQMKNTIEYIEVGGHYSLAEVEKLKLKYDKIISNTSNFVVEVRADEN